MSLGTFIRGILRKETGSTGDHGNTKQSNKTLDGRGTSSSQDAPSGPIAISAAEAISLLDKYKPIIDELDRRHVDYCIVGGLGVLLQGIDKSPEKVRLTRDVDLMIDNSIDNDSFIAIYLAAYAENEDQAEILSRHIGNSDREHYGYDSVDLENLGINPISSKRFGKEIPGIDVVRRLNGLTLAQLESEPIRINGTTYQVATISTLKEMKKRTVSMLKTSIAETSRPQDFLDLKKLDSLEALAPKSATVSARPKRHDNESIPKAANNDDFLRNRTILPDDRGRRPRR